MKEIFSKIALSHIPKILTLQDRNQHSPTYGCFDRNFWHYKIIDFPSGMSQEFVLPLSLAYSLKMPNNPYFHKSIIKDWVYAGIQFSANSSHSNGSCDDYYPYECASGAAAFSLLACLYSYDLMEFNDTKFLEFFNKRSDWLANHHESGRLTNHQALIALCLLLSSKILGTRKWDQDIDLRINRVIKWQNEEGWFQEYEGCDPGYDTLTISFLSWIYEIKPLPEIRSSLKRAVNFVSNFIHPDGTFGGEYGSRNTYNYFPHGFELVGKWHHEATTINDKFIKGLKKGLMPCYADDHIIGHHTWNYLLTYKDFIKKRQSKDKIGIKDKKWFPNAKILIEKHGKNVLYLGVKKGGVFKLFRNGELITSDTQFTLKLKNGRNAVAHMISDYKFSNENNKLIIEGDLGWAKQKLMSTFNLIILRITMYLFGRFFPNLIRSILQKLLITTKNKAPFSFKREIYWDTDNLVISDSLTAKNWEEINDIKIGADQTSIYVAMSRTYQSGQLQKWIDLNSIKADLKSNDTLYFKRII